MLCQPSQARGMLQRSACVVYAPYVLYCHETERAETVVIVALLPSARWRKHSDIHVMLCVHLTQNLCTCC